MTSAPMKPDVAVVTGAGGELGRVTSLALSATGFTVVAVDRNERGLAAVRSYFGADGKLEPAPAASALRVGTSGPEQPAEHLLEHALIQATGHGRREVVEFLLGKGPDLGVTEPFFGATARGAARYQGHAEIAALIEERLAPS